MGSLHGAYDGISEPGISSIPDLDQVLTVGNTSNIPILVKSINNTTNYYVDSATGNDSNTGLTPADPFQTIQHAFDVIAGGRFPGPVQINLAAGSYNENLVTSASLQAYIDTDDGPSVIYLVGDPVNPAAIAINGSGANATIRHVSNSVHLVINGCVITGDGSASSIGIDVKDSRLSLGDVIIQGAQTCLRGENSQIEWVADTGAGGIVDNLGVASSTGISVFNNSRMVVRRDLTIQNFTLRGIIANLFTGFQIINAGGTLNVIGDVGGASGGITITQGSVFLPGIIAAINISNCNTLATSAAISASVSGRLLFSTGSIITMTDCGQELVFTFGGSYSEGGNNTWVAAGTTLNDVQIDDSSFVNCTNDFSASNINKNQNTNFKIALDARYPRVASGFVSGVLPGPGFVGFLNQNGTQLLYIPIYVASQTETIIQMDYAARVNNGVAANDLYTVFVNGIATPMVLNINNAVAGSTTANPVALVAGDVVSIGVTSDPIATAAADIVVQLLIQKV